MRLKNFTLEGEAISLVAHLDAQTRTARYDIVCNDEDAMNDMDDAQLAAFKDALGKDLCDLESDYETTYLITLFRETWRGGAFTNGDDREESGHALREDAE